MTFAPQRPLEERFDVVYHTRSGYPPGPPRESIDFEEQAEELERKLREGDHLVGHSFGGVVSLLAAAGGPALASLTVSEPPAFGLARDVPAVVEFLRAYDSFEPSGPREYLEFFLPLVGSSVELDDTLSAELDQGARAAMVERTPDQAQIPLAALRDRAFPKLVISGGHNAAFDAVCDVLERELPAERAVLPGAGHSLPRAPGYTDVVADFVARASS
jgi:pimeloyl-ACP methyl ester carboxylesterase